MIDLSIIIVTYKNKGVIEPCLRSIKNSRTKYLYEVIVHDNASPDETADIIAKDFPWVKLIRGKNVGFAAGNNAGIKQASGRYILLLNPDTEVSEDTFEVMLDFMESHPDVGMSTGKVVLGNGKLDPACRRSFPTPWVAITRLSGLSLVFPKSKVFNQYNLGYLPEDGEYEIDCCTGAFMLVRREVVEKIGLMDESVFMYNEDVDWCYRTKAAGWKIYYYPRTTILHHKSFSARFSPLAPYWFHKSMILFYKKHFAAKYPNWFNKLMYAAIWMRYWFKTRGKPYKGPIFPGKV